MKESKDLVSPNPEKPAGSKSEPMRLVQLTPEILRDIVGIYVEVTGSELAQEFFDDQEEDQLSYVKDTLSASNVVEWRFGSKLARDTKLYLWKAGWADGERLITFAFEDNALVSDPDGFKAVELARLTQDFKTKVNAYLVEHSLFVSSPS
jgi:hypothetical protein